MSENQKLYNKIKQSKDINKSIIKSTKKILLKSQKMIENNKQYTKEGFFTFKYYLLVSQITTLTQIKEDPNFKYEDLVNAGELWTKLYYNFLKNKYKNDKQINKNKILSIIERDLT
jgi:hypothetical protein